MHDFFFFEKLFVGWLGGMKKRRKEFTMELELKGVHLTNSCDLIKNEEREEKHMRTRKCKKT